MKQRKRGRVVTITTILIIGVMCVVFYQPFMDYLTSQAANPRGFVGGVMTRIWSNSFRDLSAWTFSLVDIQAPHTVLDVGFGGGANIKHIKAHNAHCVVYGVDISEEAVKTATAFNQAHVDTGQVILTVDDVAYLPFADGLFDLVIATQTHIYWEELEKGLSECYRVLRQGGTLLISSEVDKVDYHLPEYREAGDFGVLLSGIGFAEVGVKMRGNYVGFVCEK